MLAVQARPELAWEINKEGDSVGKMEEIGLFEEMASDGSVFA